MEEAERRELAAQKGPSIVALEEPGDLPDELDAPKVILAFDDRGRPPEARVTLSVLDAALSGDKVYLGSRLTLGDERLEPGIHARSRVVDTLREELNRMWKTSIPSDALPAEGWRAKEAAAGAYLEWSLPRTGSSPPGKLRELREEFGRGYEGTGEKMQELRRGFWSAADPEGLARFIDSLEPGDLDVGRLRSLASPESLEGEFLVTEDLRKSLRSWAETSPPTEGTGPVSRRLSKAPTLERGLLLIAASLHGDPSGWSDALFAAGARSIAESLD